MQYEDAEAPDDWFMPLLDLAEADIRVMGHTHLPFVRRAAGLAGGAPWPEQ